MASAITPKGGHRGHVGPLALRVGRLARGQVHGGQRRHQRGDRLHRDPDHHRLAGGDPALEAARVVGASVEAAPAIALHRRRAASLADGIVDLGSPAARGFESHADLHALHGGNGHEQSGEPPVELPVPAHVAAEPHHHAAGDDLDLAAEGVARLLGLVDPADDLGLDRRVQDPDLRAIGRIVERDGEVGRPGSDHPAEGHDMAPDLDAELVEQPLGEGARGDPRRGLAGAGALQDVAGVEPVVLEHAGEVGVAGTRSADAAAAQLARLGRLVRHHVFPVGPVAVGDQHRHRRAERLAGADAREPLDGIALDLHARAPAVALHPAGEVPVHRTGVHRKSGGKAFDDGDEGLPVRLAGGGEAEVHGLSKSGGPNAGTTERRKDNHSAAPSFIPRCRGRSGSPVTAVRSSVVGDARRHQDDQVAPVLDLPG